MNLDLAFDELLPAPVDAVWDALTDAAAISDWLMTTPDFRAQVGVRFMMKTTHGAEDGWVRAEVLELEPPRRMVWAWSVGDRYPPTTVTFELTPEAGGTRLKLTHVGEVEPFLVDLFRNGWPGRIELLTSVAQRRSDDE